MADIKPFFHMEESLRQELIKAYQQKFPPKEFIPGITPVPVSGKVFDEQEILLATEAVLDGWWTEGRFSDQFEDKLSQWLGVKHAIMVNSGSSANLLAISALTSAKLGPKKLNPGDEVITVAAAFPTTINPIIQNGLVPVFVDIDLGSYNANIEQLKKAVSSKTKAIFLAHTLGNPVALDEILSICQENKLWLIEDNCDSFGSKYKGKYTGTFGQLSTASFYPAHQLTTGEGGAVFTNDDLLNKIVRSMRDWGRDCWCKTGHDNTCGKRFGCQLGELPLGYDHKYIYSEIGYNLKSTDLQAALGLAQLEKLDNFIKIRQENFKFLDDYFKKHEKYFVLPIWDSRAEPSWFGFMLTVKEDAPFSRRRLVAFLQERKIATRNLFGGNLIRQPYFVDNQVKHRVVGELKNTDMVMNNAFWIGCYHGLTKEMLRYVINSFDEFIEKKWKT